MEGSSRSGWVACYKPTWGEWERGLESRNCGLYSAKILPIGRIYKLFVDTFPTPRRGGGWGVRLIIKWETKKEEEKEGDTGKMEVGQDEKRDLKEICWRCVSQEGCDDMGS